MSEETTRTQKVLIVEDDEYIARAYRVGLEQAGFSVRVARDGAEGLLEVAREAPDVIILDIVMPEMDGIDMLKQLRGHASTRSLPVLVLTNSISPSQIPQVKQYGVLDILVKADWTLEGIVAKVRAVAPHAGS